MASTAWDTGWLSGAMTIGVVAFTASCLGAMEGTGGWRVGNVAVTGTWGLTSVAVLLDAGTTDDKGGASVGGASSSSWSSPSASLTMGLSLSAVSKNKTVCDHCKILHTHSKDWCGANNP